MNQKNLLLAAVAGFLLVNLGAFVVVKGLKAKGTAAAPPGPVAAPEDALRRRRDEDEGRRRRAAGLAALESADYEKALINLTEAKVLLGDQAAVEELLKVTEDLRHRARGGAAAASATGAAAVPPPAAPEPAPAPAVATATPPEEPVPATASNGARKAPPRPAPTPASPRPAPARAAPPVVVASREAATAEARPAGEPAPVRPGLLLVTTTPRGILVQVDGAAVDLTPMRLSVRAGSHKVVLLDGERHLYETQVEVLEGQATTVLRDVSAELGSARGGLDAAVADRAPPRPAEPAGEPPPRPTAAEERPAAAAPATGGLEVTSPGLYAEVWINGRPHGFPPVSARDLPAGLARIEVRVNGAVKRRAEVEVVAGQVTPVKVR